MALPLVMAGVAAVVLTLVVFTSPFRNLAARHATTPEFWVAVALIVWPPVTQVLLAQLGIESDINRSLAVLAAPITLFAAANIIRLFRKSARISSSALLLGIVAVVVAIAAFFTAQSWQHVAVAMIALLCVGVASRGRSDAAGAGVVVGVTAVVALTGLYAVAVPGALRTTCGDNVSKCELLGGFVSVGTESGSNAFGITLAVLVGFVVYRLGAMRGLIAGIAVTALILSTGARLATVCAAVVVLIAFVIVATRARPFWQRMFVGGGLAAAIISSVVTAAVPFHPMAFTERATLWHRAQEFVMQSPLFGHGVSFWVRDAATQPPPPRSYAPHNVWLELLVSVGFVGTIALVLIVWRGIRRSKPNAVSAITLVIGLLLVGTFESTVIPFRLGPIPTGFLILVLILATSERATGTTKKHSEIDDAKSNL